MNFIYILLVDSPTTLKVNYSILTVEGCNSLVIALSHCLTTENSEVYAGMNFIYISLVIFLDSPTTLKVNYSILTIKECNT